MKKIYIYDTFNRLWHWIQSALIFFLALTGFEIHSSYEFFGYETAVAWHNIAAFAFIILIILAIFWHFTSGTWVNYIPTTKNLIEQIRYYTIDIFKNVPHPVRKTKLSKLNPLQKLVYLGLKLLVIPVMVVTGLLYMYYRYPQKDSIEQLDISGIGTIAVLHTIGAFAIVFFVIMHLYLITTGRTSTSNLEAMITGYETIDDDEENHETADDLIDNKGIKV